MKRSTGTGPNTLDMQNPPIYPYGMLRCSIVIPVFNHAALTRQCLDALLKTTGSACEVIVVDDASRDETQAVLGAYRDRIRVFTHTQNAGFAVSCNDGAAAAQGEFLVFLNNDTIPKEGWLEALVAYADAHPRAAVVGAKLLFPNETIQHAGMVFRTDRHPSHIYLGFPADHPAVNKSRRFQIVTGACMLVRRKLFEDTGRFNTAFLNSHEDMDLCLRMGKAGHEVHYCHTSVLCHMESATREPQSPVEVRNFELFLSRWEDHIQPDEFRYYVEDELIKPVHNLQYPIELTISPLLATKVHWEKPELVDHILQRRSEQVYKLLRDNINLRVRLQNLEAKPDTQPVGAHAVESENRPSKTEARITPFPSRQEELQALLWQAHGELLKRDQAIHNVLQTPDAQTYITLTGFLNQLNDAVAKLYRSSRWRWANPLQALKGIIGGSKSPPAGYWRIDNVLDAYKAWQCHQPGGAAWELTGGSGEERSGTSQTGLAKKSAAAHATATESKPTARRSKF